MYYAKMIYFYTFSNVLINSKGIYIIYTECPRIYRNFIGQSKIREKRVNRREISSALQVLFPAPKLIIFLFRAQKYLSGRRGGKTEGRRPGGEGGGKSPTQDAEKAPVSGLGVRFVS